MSTERVQKLLATAGYGSRREIERWIGAGRVKVNGKVISVGDKASASDRIEFDGKPLRLSQREPIPQVIAYHKPIGEICTRHDPEGRPTVFDNLPELRRGRWVSVGRLDVNTCGLLLFATDGALAEALMHPSHEIIRKYAVRVLGHPSDADIARLTTGVTLDDGPAKFAQVDRADGHEAIDGVHQSSNLWFHVTLREGRKREVRRLWEAIGCKVSRLIRIAFGPIQLPRNLPRGKWASLQPRQLERLYKEAGVPIPEALAEQLSQFTPKRRSHKKPYSGDRKSSMPGAKKPTSGKPAGRKSGPKKPSSRPSKTGPGAAPGNPWRKPG